MTLTQLEYIIAVDTFGSFSKAAKKCFITQPTLSIQIQKLEFELGVTIFRREKYPITPTGIGLKIIEQAKQVIKEKEEINVLLQIEKGEFTGKLNLSIIPTISSYLIPMFLSNFIKKYPNIELIIDEVTTSEVISGLEKGVFDLGIIALRSFNENLITEVLYYEPFVAFIPSNHKLISREKIRQEDLNVGDFLLLKEGHCLRDQTLSICKSSDHEWLEKNNKVIFESGNLETLINLVDQKFGMTLLPYLAVKYLKGREKMNQLKEFTNPIPKREIGFIYPNSFIKKHFLRALREEIMKVIPVGFRKNKKGLIIH